MKKYQNEVRALAVEKNRSRGHAFQVIIRQEDRLSQQMNRLGFEIRSEQDRLGLKPRREVDPVRRKRQKVA